MSFDVDGARQAGYSDKDIAEYLAPRRNFNIGGAREAGYSDADIVSYLMSRPAPAGRETVAQTQVTAPPAPERGFFGGIASLAGDTGASIVTGAGSALSGIGGLGGVAGLGYDNMLSRAGRRVSEFGEGLMSPELVEKRQALSRAIQDAESQGLVGEARAALSTLASNPSLLFSMAIEQIPAFVLSGGVGRGASAIGQVAARRAAVGGGEAAEQAILQAGQRAGQVAAVGTAAGLQGGSVAEETYQDVMRLPGETLQRSPTYQELLRSMSPDEARSTIADRAAREAGLLGGGISVATMSVMPSAERAMFSRGVSQSAIRRALGVGTGEFVSEGIEEGGGQFAQNLAIQRRADEERSLTQGVGGAAATGAVLGGIMGGGIGAIQRPPIPPSTEPGAGNLPSDLRTAIEDYVANREPMTEGQNLLPREMRDVETPVGNLSRSQLLRFMERSLPGMMNEDPEIASRMAYARNENERLDAFREILQQRQDERVAARQGSEEGNIRREIATSPETAEAFRRAELQERFGRDVSEVGTRVPLERDTPYAGGRRAEAESAFGQVDLQQRTGLRPTSEQEIRRNLASAETRIQELGKARDEAAKRLRDIEKAKVLDAPAREATLAEIEQLDQLIVGNEAVRREIANSLPVTERDITARENLRAQAGEAFDVVQGRRENLERQQQAPGLEIPSGSGVPDTIPQQTDDTRAGAPMLSDMRYVLNPEYKKGKLVGGENVVEIGQADEFGNVLAYVERKRGNITETVPVETTMNKLVQIPIRGTARATQESIGAGVTPPRGVGTGTEPRRATDRQTPQASARAAGAEQAAPQAEAGPSDADVRASRRIAAQNKINELYLDKLKGMGAQGRLIRNALVNALKDRTMSAQEVYASFTAADTLATLLPAGANHRIQFVEKLLPTKELAEAIARSGGDPTKELQGLRDRPSGMGLPGIITISLSPSSNVMPYLTETAAHEAFHVLQDYYGKYDPQFAKLMDQSFRDNMRIGDVDPTIRRKLEQARYPNSSKSYWQVLSESLPNVIEDAKEAQAYVFAALMDASRRGVPMTGLKPAFARFVNVIKNFFSKLGSKLRGDGFQTVEEVLGRVAREGGRRFDQMATPTERDFPSRGAQASARSGGYSPSFVSQDELALTSVPFIHAGNEGSGVRRNVTEAAKYLQARNREIIQRVYGKTDLSAMTEENQDILARLMAEELVAEYNRKQSEEKNEKEVGSGWYSDKLTDCLSIMSLIHPEIATDPDSRMAYLVGLALSSNGQAVPDNLNHSLVLYEGWKASAPDINDRRIPTDFTFGGARIGQMKMGVTAFNKMLDVLGYEDARKFLNSKFTVAELEAMGYEVSGENKDAVVYGSAALGPKLGQGFYQNLDGNFDPLTMDMWYMRSWGRLVGRLIDPDPATIAKQQNRVRQILSDGNEPRPGFATPERVDAAMRDEQALYDLSTDIYAAYLRGGFKDKNNLNRAAKALWESFNEPKQAPSGGNERDYIRRTFAKALKLAADRGVKIETADGQAIWWYPEKRLWSALGVRDAKSKPTDYAIEAERLATGRGFDGDDIERIRAVGRGRRRAVRELAGDTVRAEAGYDPFGAARLVFETEERLSFLRDRAFQTLEDAGVDLLDLYKKGAGGTQEIAGQRMKVDAKFTPDTKIANRLERIRMSAPKFFEVTSNGGDLFRSIYRGNQDIQGGRLFLTEDGKAGFVVKDGELIASFADPAAHSASELAVASLGVRTGATSASPRLEERPSYERVGFRENEQGDMIASLQAAARNVQFSARGDAITDFDIVQSSGTRAKASYVFAADLKAGGYLKIDATVSGDEVNIDRIVAMQIQKNPFKYKTTGFNEYSEGVRLGFSGAKDLLRRIQDALRPAHPVINKFTGQRVTGARMKDARARGRMNDKERLSMSAKMPGRLPQLSARSPLASDPAFAALRDKLTGKEYDKPGIFSDALRRFTGALPGEKNSSALVRTMVNRAAPGWMLDRLAKEKGLSMKSVGLALEVALNNSGRVQMYLDHGPLGYDPKTGDVKVREDVPGLIAAIKGRLKIADKREAQSYLVALRERDLRKTGKKGFFNLTDEEINQIISKSEAAHPEWKQMAADIQRINKALLDFAVATGTLDRSKADQLGSMFYTPFYRQADEDAQKNANEVVGPRLSDSLTRVKTAFDVSLKGGENPLGDLFENMIRNADVIMKAGMKNVAMRQAAEVMDAVGLGRPSKERVSGKTITYRVDGQDKNFEVDDPVLYTALAGAPRHVTNGIYQTMANFAGFFRDMITIAPSFMLANLWRGKIMAYVQEGVPFYANTFDGLRQALKSSASYKAIAAQTGFGGYTYGMGERDATEALEREIGGVGYGPKGLLRRTYDALQKASEATEMAERIKLYERAKAQGMTDKEAAFQAYLLAPFSRRGMGGGWAGETVNFLVPLVPFLNAKIQGMYRLIENEKGDTRVLKSIPKQMFLRGLVVMAASLALAAKNIADEPERWDDENPDMKFRYDIIYLPNDKRILLPRAFEVGSVFGALPVFILDAWRRDDSRDLSKALTDLGMSTFFFNPIPAAVVPVIGAATNYDFFRARALETAGDRSKLPEERVNRSTSAIAKFIGEQAGVSPIRVQYVLEGYSGTIGANVLAGFDSILASAGLIPNKPAGAFGDPMSMPAIVAGLTGASRFYRSDDQTASRFVGDFYKIKEMTDQLVRSQNMAVESRDLDRLAELRGDAGLPLRLRPMVNQASTQINEINKRMARIERSDLDSVSMADALRPLREQRDRVAKRVVERARQIGAY